MSQIEFFNQKYVGEHITAFKATKFYVEDDTVREVYYNPDSNAGGQLVTNYYSRTDIAETYEKHTDPNNFWEHLESIAKQYLAVIDTSEFESEVKGVSYVISSLYLNCSGRRDVFRHRRSFSFSALLYLKRNQIPHSG